MPQNLRLADLATLLTVALSLAGLIWNAAEQVGVNQRQTQDIERLDSTMAKMDDAQRADHDAIVKMQGGIDYLVDRAKAREGKR